MLTEADMIEAMGYYDNTANNIHANDKRIGPMR